MFGKNRFLKQLESKWKRLYRLAYSWTHDPHLARDLVQETMSRAISKHKQLKDLGALDSWLFKILVNCWHDVCRQNKHLQPLLDADELVNNYTPDMDRYRYEVIKKVHSAIVKLPMEQRQIITLIDLEGLSYSEVANIMEVPMGTVMSRLCRARNKLKTHLGELKSQDKVGATDKYGDNVRRIK